MCWFFSLPSAVWPERRTIHLLAASIGPSCGFFTTSLSAARVALPLTVRPIQTGECAGGGEYWHCSPFPAPIVLIRLHQREKTSSNLRLLCPHVANLPFSDQPRADYRFISLGSRMRLGTRGVLQVGDCGRRWGRPDRCKSFSSSEDWSKLGPHSLSVNFMQHARICTGFCVLIMIIHILCMIIWKLVNVLVCQHLTNFCHFARCMHILAKLCLS